MDGEGVGVNVCGGESCGKDCCVLDDVPGIAGRFEGATAGVKPLKFGKNPDNDSDGVKLTPGKLNCALAALKNIAVTAKVTNFISVTRKILN